MELKNLKLYHSAGGLSFAVYSDDLCRACYNESIQIPFNQSTVDVYHIDPGPQSSWVAVEQRDSDKASYELFLREGSRLHWRKLSRLPSNIRDEILRRCPEFPRDLHPRKLKKTWTKTR